MGVAPDNADRVGTAEGEALLMGRRPEPIVHAGVQHTRRADPTDLDLDGSLRRVLRRLRVGPKATDPHRRAVPHDRLSIIDQIGDLHDDIVTAGYAKRPSVPLDALDDERIAMLMGAIEELIAEPSDQ